MVDPNALVAVWLRSLNLLPNILPARGGTGSIYAVNLPPDFVITDGPTILVAARTGTSQTEISGIIQPRMQITVWDNVGQAQRARQVYSALYDAIDGKGNIAINGVGTIMSCYEVQPPQDLTDPETDWATVVSFYELFARS